MVDKKRIAKNSLWLYLRMLVVTVVSLYTSRIVLKSLGVSDFGIYNATGSLVSFFTILTNSLSNGTQRFLNVKKGEDSQEGMANILGVSINLYVILSAILLVIAETVGLYLLFSVMNFPDGKLMDAFWVYQSSILVLIFSFFKVPYLAVVITYEKFNFVAWTSLLDVAMKLFLAFSLDYYVEGKLIYYGFSFTALAILQFILFKRLSSSLLKAEKISIRSTFKMEETKDLLSFSSWNILGSFSSIMSNQGICIVLNIFYSVTVNAAMGISNQVTNTIATMVGTVQQAFRPQLLQNYVNPDKRQFLDLLYDSTRWSFLMIMLIAGPLICNLDVVLKFWLGEFPVYSDTFIAILVGYLIINSVSMPLSYAIDATGRIRNFQIGQMVVNLLNVLLAYIVCKVGGSPNVAIFSKVMANLSIYLLKLYVVSKQIEAFSLIDYFKQILGRLLVLEMVCWGMIYYLYQQAGSFLFMIVSSIIYVAVLSLFSLTLVLSKKEKLYLKSKFKR